VVPGSGHPSLAAEIASLLNVPLAPVERERFPDGELGLSITASLRGIPAVIVQPTGPPVDESLVELLALADACRRAAAERIVAVVPYLGYARGDRRHAPRGPIMASLVAQLLQAAGVEHLVAVDLHAPQIEGFFQIPVDDLSPFVPLLEAVRPSLPSELVVVSPDLGRIGLATRFADVLHAGVAVVQKRRISGRATRTLQVIGDVRDRPALVVDDMITSGGTIAGCVEALLAAGARPEIVVAASHGLFVGDAAARLEHEAIRAIWVTDTLPPAPSNPRPRVVGIAPLIAAAVRELLPD
jgi:ribose-phosphate pyrophosphokinase